MLSGSWWPGSPLVMVGLTLWAIYGPQQCGLWLTLFWVEAGGLALPVWSPGDGWPDWVGHIWPTAVWIRVNSILSGSWWPGSACLYPWWWLASSSFYPSLPPGSWKKELTLLYEPRSIFTMQCWAPGLQFALMLLRVNGTECENHARWCVRIFRKLLVVGWKKNVWSL